MEGDDLELKLITFTVLSTYGFIAMGVAHGIDPVFSGTIERLIVRISVGIVWPFYFGCQLARKLDRETKSK